MPTQKNIDTVQELAEKFSRCTVAVGTDFSRMSVKAMTELRHHLWEQGVEYRVVKNRLAQRAAEAAEQPAIIEVLEGPTGFAFGYGDPMMPVKLLVEYARANRIPLAIRGAVLDGTLYKREAAIALAALPSRQELAAQLVGQLSSPLSRLATVLNQPLYGLVTVLNGPLAALASVLRQRVAQQV